MPANISMFGNVAEMAFVGEKPWHGLGQELTPNQPLEVWLKAAGMDWRVQRSMVRFATAHDQTAPDFQVWKDRHVLFRSDNHFPLGVVSDGYKIVQPREVLEFFAHVAEENKITLETAGVLNMGRQYWALAKLGPEFTIAGVDRVKAYALLATSADGSLATIAKQVATRVVCSNTMAMAMGEAGKAIKVKHSSRFDAQQVRIDLGLCEKVFAEYEQNAYRLASRRLSRQDALQVLIRSIGDEEAFRKAYGETGVVDIALKEQPNVRQMGEIMELFNGKARGSNSVTASQTAWGLVNAATEFYDHIAGRAQDSRLQSSWFGVNEARKQAIFANALALAE